MEKKSRSATVTVLLMIVAMLISKVLGMFRGVLLAAAYGTTENATAFSAASRIPLSFFDIVFASAILGCFIPVYNSFNEGNKEKDRNAFTAIYLNFILLLTGVFALLGIVFAESLIEIVAPGMLPETKELSVFLLRIMFPLIIFAASSYTFVGVLQSNDSYIAPAFISAVSNVIIILYFLFFDGSFGIKGLAVTYSLAWLAQLLTLVVPVIKTGFKYKLLLDFKNKGFVFALKLTPPIIMGSWLSPVCMLLSMRFATYTATQGAIPSFEYAMNLFTVITGITTYGVCNYIFPKLSSQANVSSENFAQTGRLGLVSALLMTVPISAAVLSLAPEGISIVYLRGSFDSTAAEKVVTILTSLVPGMLGFTLVEFLSRTFYAMKKPKFVVISVVIGIVTDLFMLWLLIGLLDMDILALGISYSAGILSAGLSMLVFAAVNIKGFFDSKFLFDLLKILVSGVASAGVMILVKALIGTDAYTCGFFMNVITAIITVLAGCAAYFVLLFILRENTVSLLKSKKE